MEENKSLQENSGENEVSPATIQEETPNTAANAITVKYNKEIKELSPEKARELAQKGLKYEQIENDYIRLKNIAKEEGLCVSELLCGMEKEKVSRRKSELLEQCGGNNELADYVLSLESGKQNTDNGFEELKTMFPEIKQIGELPEEVIESSNLNGKNLLDSYLRYLYSRKLDETKLQKQKKAEEKTLIGSLASGKTDPASATDREFIKALWKR